MSVNKLLISGSNFQYINGSKESSISVNTRYIIETIETKNE